MAEDVEREHAALAQRVRELQREHDHLERQGQVDVTQHEAHLVRLRSLKRDLDEHLQRLHKLHQQMGDRFGKPSS